MNILMLIGSVLFGISVYGLLSSKNMARILISAEVMFNAFILYVLSYVVSVSSIFSDAVVFISSLVLMAILLAVGEIVVSFSILLALIKFKVLKRIDTEEVVIKDLRYEEEKK
jgi:NADH-quinone oxidoreductase subunit K